MLFYCMLQHFINSNAISRSDHFISHDGNKKYIISHYEAVCVLLQSSQEKMYKAMDDLRNKKLNYVTAQ